MPGMTVGADRDGLQEISSASPRGGGPKKKNLSGWFSSHLPPGSDQSAADRPGCQLQTREPPVTPAHTPLMIPRAATLAAARPFGILDSLPHVGAFVCLCGTAALFV